ncbi:MAG: helix-turn-helix domain-containing protein [Pseudonocardiaceae bacterium]
MSTARHFDTLSAILRKLRQDAGLPGVEAARRAGMSQATISRAL